MGVEDAEEPPVLLEPDPVLLELDPVLLELDPVLSVVDPVLPVLVEPPAPPLAGASCPAPGMGAVEVLVGPPGVPTVGPGGVALGSACAKATGAETASMAATAPAKVQLRVFRVCMEGKAPFRQFLQSDRD